MQQLRQRMGRRLPCGMFRRHLMRRQAGARGQRAARREALYAIAMEGTDSGPVIARFASHSDMTQFGVSEAVYQASTRNQSDADAGPDGDVGKIREVPGGPPSTLGQRRAVHVGIEGDRHVERLRQVDRRRGCCANPAWRVDVMQP